MVEGWKTVNIQKGLIEEVRRLLEMKTVENEGLTNVSQFVTAAVREKIKRTEQKRFDHINTYEDHVKILDNKLEARGRIVSVFFRDRRAWCDYCEEHMCVHIQYAWEIPEVRKILGENQTGPPPSKLP